MRQGVDVADMGVRFELDLSDLAHGGDAVGRHEGLAVFVPLAIPGERVRVEVTGRRKRYVRARLLDVLTPSPHRVEPICPHYDRCGGCQIQHIAYPMQLELKRHILQSQLEHIGKQVDPTVRPAVAMDVPWHYRNHVQFSVDAEGRLGYLSRAGDEIVPVSECPILEPALEQVRRGLSGDLRGVERVVIRAGIATGERLVILEGPAGDPPPVELPAGVSCLWRPSRGEPLVVRGHDYLHERVAGRTFRIAASSFFQVNTRQAERLVAAAEEHLRVQPGETVVDAYCGVGLFALTLAEGATRVVGIEESSSAVRDARVNALGRPCIGFLQGRVEQLADRLPRRVDAVIVDPPRGGCVPRVLEALAARGPARIVYVSCDPATLARDAAHLARLGYVLRETRPVDMFPQTYHIETVSLLARRSPAPTPAAPAGRGAAQ